MPSVSQLTHYVVDFQVRKALWSLLTSRKTWRQFQVTGQSLDVFNQDKRENSFHLPDVSLEHVSTHLFRLKVSRWHHLEFSSPSASRLERFRHVLERAASSPEWSPPTHDVLANFLHVAKEINEAEATIPSKVATSSVTVAQVQDHFNEML
ncbi:unnamed protein product, partial [Aphanomyces euteiches]